VLVAFVCTGNICRSPMAEGFAAAHHPSPAVAFVSSGTSAVNGVPASAKTIRVMADAGIALEGHLSQRLDRVAATEPDMIYTMTETQAAHVRRAHPGLASRVRLLDRDGRDIADPYGRSLEDYVMARDQIAVAVSRRAHEWAG
jgi:protein-tyrosine-phosphatase